MEMFFDKPYVSKAARSLGQVDVWRVQLHHPLPWALTKDILSPDELARAERFRFDKDRAHFIRCRTALKCILGRYIGIPACEVRFDYQVHGKPELVSDQNPMQLRFNVTHSGELALIAVGAHQRLGIDIEKMRADVDIAALSRQCLSVRERAGVMSLREDRRLPAFFACWTRKEAFLKATGEGFSFPLSDFTVAVDPEADPDIEEIRGDRLAAKHWFLKDLILADDYRATLAVEHHPAIVESYCWN